MTTRPTRLDTFIDWFSAVFCVFAFLLMGFVPKDQEEG